MDHNACVTIARTCTCMCIHVQGTVVINNLHSMTK